MTEWQGKNGYYSFMKRRPELLLHEPESTSVARAQGFNRIRAFFGVASQSLRRRGANTKQAV